MSLTEIQKDSINNKSDMDNIQHNYIFSTINSNNNSINLNHNTSMCNRVVGLNNDYYNTPSIIDINSELDFYLAEKIARKYNLCLMN